jgi:hypothetical protein
VSFFLFHCQLWCHLTGKQKTKGQRANVTKDKNKLKEVEGITSQLATNSNQQQDSQKTKESTAVPLASRV